MASGLFLFLSPVISPLANACIDKYGPTFAVRLGCVLTALGCWLRIFINNNFGFVLAGHTIAGIGGPFIYNAKGTVGLNWFTPESIV